MRKVWVLYITWDVRHSIFHDDATNTQEACYDYDTVEWLLASYAHYPNLVCIHVCEERELLP